MSQPCVLVADDNALTLRFFAEAIGSFGITCVEAHDGLAAVDRAFSIRCDLLLLDDRMPHCDGAEALARIRAGVGASRRSVALATTAETGSAARARLERAGFAEVLHKPLGVDALHAACARHLTLPMATSARSIPSTASDVAAALPIVDSSGSPPVELDDLAALAVAGGDRAIVAALRGLLRSELDALPAEVAGMGTAANRIALAERLHRLDASAGFCGVPTLAAASTRLRHTLDAAATWPDSAITDFLVDCARARRALGAG